MDRWSIVGSSGFVGSALLKAINARGSTARPIRAPRLATAPTSTPRQLIDAALDHKLTSVLADEMRGQDVVVNAAGIATSGARRSAGLFGANALLPILLAVAARQAGVPHFIHLSTAAVQGRRSVLDNSRDLAPFSPYSRSKALAEQALWILQDDRSRSALARLVIVRATSVQGDGRRTTTALSRIAASPLATVASPGDQPTPVTTLASLVNLVLQVPPHTPVAPIVLQPWAGQTTSSVLRELGGRNPRQLPPRLCRSVIRVAWPVSVALGPRAIGRVRQLELMWLGQRQVDANEGGAF